VPGAALDRRRRQVRLDVEERSAGHVAYEIQPAPEARLAELPAAVDEAEVGHAPSVRDALATQRRIKGITSRRKR
jgi:hypothetical protein